MVPYCSLQLPCSPEDTLFTALNTVQSKGIDLSALKLMYISRGYLQIPSCRSKPNSLVMIFESDNASILAGWSVPLQDPPSFQDIPNMHRIRRLYELDAGLTVPVSFGSAFSERTWEWRLLVYIFSSLLLRAP